VPVYEGPNSQGCYVLLLIPEEDDHMNTVKRFVRDEQGQDLIEYALLATFVALVAIVGATQLGTALNNWYGNTAGAVNTSAASAS
jgi:Flp pilus assembly pilin Flp